MITAGWRRWQEDGGVFGDDGEDLQRADLATGKLHDDALARRAAHDRLPDRRSDRHLIRPDRLV